MTSSIIIPKKNCVASFDVDAQNTFTPICPTELPVAEGDQIVTELNLQATKAQYRLGSKDAHPSNAVWLASDEQPALSRLDYPNADCAWPAHAMLGTQGFELITGLPAITDYDYFVWKGIEPDLHPYGACYHDLAENLSTGAIEFLKIKQVQCVLVGGLATDYCVKATALQLQKAGFQVIVNLAASRGVAPGSTEQAIVDMQAAGITIVGSANLLANT